jgi:hypothetical protein
VELAENQGFFNCENPTEFFGGNHQMQDGGIVAGNQLAASGTRGSARAARASSVDQGHSLTRVPGVNFLWSLAILRYNRGAMQIHQVVNAIVVGSALIALGLLPGLFHGLKEGVRNFSRSFWSPFSSIVGVPHRTDYEKVPGPMWLALVGIAVIFLSLLLYISNFSG